MSELKQPDLLKSPATITAVAASTPTVVLPPKASMAMGSLGLQINTLDDLWRVSKIFHEAKIAPKGLDTVEQIFACLEMGKEIGLPLMASLTNICVINGRPSVWGDCMLGIVQSSPLCEYFDETLSNDPIDATFRTLCLTTDKALRRELRIQLGQMLSKIDKNAPDFGSTVCTRRAGGEERFGRFTAADAKTAGLTAKSGPWTQTPFRMLTFRARNFLLRDVYPDLLKGISSAEEMRDIQDADRFAAAIPTFPVEERTLPEPVKEGTK